MSEYSDTQSLSVRQQVFKLLEKTHDLKARELCAIIHLPYSRYRETIQEYRQQWKSEYRSRLPPKSPTSQHHCRAFCYVPESVDRKVALDVGWSLSRNRNRLLVWKDQMYGRIEWWETRRVVVHINKPQSLGRVKQFLSNAFFKTGLIWDVKIFNPWIESVQWLGAHDVFETADRVPYKVIDAYKDTMGFVFKAGDLSHRSSYEFEWCKPQWMERFEFLSLQAFSFLEHNARALELDAKALENGSKAIQQFSKFMSDLSTPKPEGKTKNPMIV